MNTKNNNKNNDKILEKIITPSGDNLLVKSRDNQNYLFLENSNYKLTPNKFLSLFIKDNKLILDDFPKIVKLLKLNEVSKPKYFIKEIKHLETEKTMNYVEFKKLFSKSNYAKENNLTFKTISQDIILDYVNNNLDNWSVKLEDNNSDNSLFDNDNNAVVDMFQNDMKNNQFEASKNVSRRLLKDDEIIELNKHLSNEDKSVKMKYGIKRLFNSEWNTENSKSLDKYIKYFDDVVNKKSTSKNNNVVSNNSVSLEL